MLEFDMNEPECTDALGMASGAIANCQLVASSDWTTNDATNSRLNNSGGVFINAPRGPPFAQHEYLQVRTYMIF